MHHSSTRQSGMVSIMTVLFFMIFVSVIVIGFVRIMTYEQRQATDNDLSASAFAAAESGVEDGMRILMLCRSATITPAVQTACDRLFAANGDCSVAVSTGGATDTTALRTALGINLAPDGQSMVVGDSTGAFKQFYSCLTIGKSSPQIVKRLTAGRSTVLPLSVAAADSYDRINVSWKSDTGSFGVELPYTSLPQYNQWKTAVGAVQKPPMLRVEIIPYTTPLDLNAVEHDTRTLFISPSTGGSATVDLAADGRGASGRVRSGTTPITPALCTAPGLGYSCQTTITGFTVPAKKYYMRATVLYGDSTNLTVNAYNASGTSVAFEGAQSVVDVTGRANDVYRRIRAYASAGVPDINSPEFALESASDLCKNMVVADAATSLDRCTPAPVTPPPTDTFGGCTVSGGNFVFNGGFDQGPDLAGAGPYVDPQAGFESELPNRGTDVYPDDSGVNGTSPVYTGGFSIQTMEHTYLYPPVTGWPFAHAVPFAGDPARGIPAAANYFYSNPNQSVSDTPGHDALLDPFTGVLWGQNVTGLQAGKTYVFAAYFHNMLIPATISTDPSYRNPFVKLLVNGTAANVPYEVLPLASDPDAWTPVYVTFTAPASITPSSLVKLEIFDEAHSINGDDFAMTGISFYQCE